MTIIHCGFVLNQNRGINQGLISKRNNPEYNSTTKLSPKPLAII